MFFLNEKISDFVSPSDELLVMTGSSSGTLHFISNVIIILRVDDQLIIPRCLLNLAAH
jgi:hypothetical protein